MKPDEELLRRTVADSFKDAVAMQTEFQKDLNEHARIRDILFVLYCLIVPFFSENYFFISIIYGVIGLFYLRITIDFRKECYVYEESPKANRGVIEQHREFFSNRNIRY